MLPYDERLERLLAAVARVFAKKGYHATTMRDLARASGMSLAGMYHYVGGKEELLYLIQRRFFELVLQGASAAVAAAPDPVTKLRAFIHHHVGVFAAHMSEMKVLAREAETLTGERDREIRDLKRRYVDLLAGCIEGLDGVDPRTAAYALFGMMNWIHTWYRTGGRLSAPELADEFAELFLHGVQGAPAGARRAGGTPGI
jgi:AcrR family transcriptional regulator